jgi:hypothetical protein
VRRDGYVGDECESVGNVDSGKVCKGMVEVGIAGIADVVVALGLYGELGVSLPSCQRLRRKHLEPSVGEATWGRLG